MIQSQKRPTSSSNGRARRFILILGLAFIPVTLTFGFPAHAAGPNAPLMAVLPFELDDNSGEIDTSDRHDAMLSAVTAEVRQEIAAAGHYRVSSPEEVSNAIKSINPGTYLRDCNGCELDIAKRVGAQRVLIGWFFKMSTLIGTLHIRIEDVATKRVVYRKDFDFRGDNERAWKRAVQYFVQSVK